MRRGKGEERSRIMRRRDDDTCNKEKEGRRNDKEKRMRGSL